METMSNGPEVESGDGFPGSYSPEELLKEGLFVLFGGREAKRQSGFAPEWPNPGPLKPRIISPEEYMREAEVIKSVGYDSLERQRAAHPVAFKLGRLIRKLI